MSRAICKVAVIGGGAMGQGIALLISQQGVPVVIKEVSDQLAQKAYDTLIRKMDAAIARGKVMQDKGEMAKALISVTANYADIADADIAIEAVFEKMDIKKAVLAELDRNLPPDVILASNTSSLSITEMASVTNRPDKVIGMHFFNPPVTMPLVELIRGSKTSDETMDAVEDLSKNSLGKVTIRVKECPAFLVNRLLLPYLNEATRLLAETTLTVEQIDEAARSFGWPMGPFFLMDYLGIDVCAEVAEICARGYGERANPSQLMHRMVQAGRLGNKSGGGFYINDETKGFESMPDILASGFSNRVQLSADEGFRRMMVGMVNEAFLCLQEQISSADDVESGCLYGIGFPAALEGPLHWAESQGLANILADLKRFEQAYGARFAPSALLEKYVAEGTKLFESW